MAAALADLRPSKKVLAHRQNDSKLNPEGSSAD